MKRKIISLVLVLLLAVSICVPVLADSDYGSIYDGTEKLGSDALKNLGESTLPMLSEQLGFDMRVDVLTRLNFDTVEETAAELFSRYDYGLGDDMRGVSLTIIMDPIEGGYAMTPGNWCVYVGSDDDNADYTALRDKIVEAVSPYMADVAWDGSDLTMSATALTQATSAMIAAVSDYFLGESTEPVDTVITEPSGDANMNYVLDFADLLGYDEWSALEARAAEISSRLGCGVYVITLSDYADYGSDIESVIEDSFHELKLGEAFGGNGIVLMLSLNDRDYATFVYGEQAEYAFSDYGLKRLEDTFLDNFADNDWNGGFSDYISTCAEYLELAANGDPVRQSPTFAIVICVAASCLIALLICRMLKKKMQSVKKKVEANEYVAGGLKLTGSQDNFTHITETRRKIEKNNSGGSSSFSGSGGGHGRSGKF